MKKIRWFDEDNETHPNEENMVIISALDTIIERICKLHTFESMFENIGCNEYFPKKMDNESQYRYGRFKDFLEEKFMSVRRVNKHGMIPAWFSWVLQFENIQMKITKEQSQELLTKNFNLYKGRIEPYLDDFELGSNLFYDLTTDKFISYI